MTPGATQRVAALWARHGERVVTAAMALMAVLAVAKLGTELHRLVWEPGRTGAIDLKLLHGLVRLWFEGEPVYRVSGSATYPPASLLLLWPLLGWMEVGPARVLWAVTSAGALAWLAWVLVRRSGATTSRDRLLVVLILLSMNATGVAVGNGQLILHVLPALLTAVFLLTRDRPRWPTDLLAAGLMLAALVKPAVSAPFFWLVLWVPRRARPAALVAAGYAALTVVAARFQPADVVELLRQWAVVGGTKAVRVAVDLSHSNLHAWSVHAGLERWAPALSLALLGLTGLWVCRHRGQDLWLLLGATAISARLWTYHGLYDNALMVVPVVALLTVARRPDSTEGERAAAEILAVVTALALLIPARMHNAWPPPWPLVHELVHTTVWLCDLGFILARTRRLARAGAMPRSAVGPPTARQTPS